MTRQRGIALVGSPRSSQPHGGKTSESQSEREQGATDRDASNIPILPISLPQFPSQIGHMRLCSKPFIGGSRKCRLFHV